MSERFRQQLRIAKLIANVFFERMHIRASGSLGRTARLLFVNSDRSHQVNRALNHRIVRRRLFPRPRAARWRRVQFGIGARKQGRLVQMRPVGFEDEWRHPFR